jgi:hypothetical protein
MGSGFPLAQIGGINRPMPAPTRRKNTDRPDRWIVYSGDISVGSIGRCAGVPLHVDQWELGLRFPAGVEPGDCGRRNCCDL